MIVMLFSGKLRARLLLSPELLTPARPRVRFAGSGRIVVLNRPMFGWGWRPTAWLGRNCAARRCGTTSF